MELNTPKMSSEEIIKNFIMHEKIATCNKKTKMFIYLSILQNQHLCIMTDYYWFCVCEGMMSVTGCEVSKFVENIQDTFEQCAQYYLRNKVKEFYDVHRKNLLLQKKIMAIIPAFQEVLDKEYQYKFTYQGHDIIHTNLDNSMVPGFLKVYAIQKIFILEVLIFLIRKIIMTDLLALNIAYYSSCLSCLQFW